VNGIFGEDIARASRRSSTYEAEERQAGYREENAAQLHIVEVWLASE
jgi:hypothetical protein